MISLQAALLGIAEQMCDVIDRQEGAEHYMRILEVYNDVEGETAAVTGEVCANFLSIKRWRTR